MPPEEADRFMNLGRDLVTEMAQTTDRFESYARTFEIRGGAPPLGEAGDETLDMIAFWNRLSAWLTPENQAVLDKYRTDF